MIETSGCWIHSDPDTGQGWISERVHCADCGRQYAAVWPAEPPDAFTCPHCGDQSVWTYEPLSIEA